MGRFLHNLEMIVGRLGFLVLNIFLPHVVGHVSTGHDPVATAPEVLAPIPFPQRRIFREQLMRTFPLQELHRLGDRQARRYRHEHVHVIPVDRPCVDHHLLAQGDLTEQFTTAIPDVTRQNGKPIFRNPYNMILTVPYRMAATLEALHPALYALSQPAKAGGFTDPQIRTLKRRSDSGELRIS